MSDSNDLKFLGCVLHASVVILQSTTAYLLKLNKHVCLLYFVY